MYTVYYNAPLQHHGVKGMKWGVRRYRNRDGTLTPAGKKRYYKDGQKQHQHGPGVAIGDNKQRFYLAKKGFASDREMAYGGNTRNKIASMFGGDARARKGVALAEATATAAVKGHLAAKTGKAIAGMLYQKGFFNNADIPFAIRVGTAIMLTPQMQYALQLPAAVSKYKYAQDSMATDIERTKAGKPKVSRYEISADKALEEKNHNILGYRNGLKMDFSRGKEAKNQKLANKYSRQLTKAALNTKDPYNPNPRDEKKLIKAYTDMHKRGYKLMKDHETGTVYFEKKQKGEIDPYEAILPERERRRK